MNAIAKPPLYRPPLQSDDAPAPTDEERRLMFPFVDLNLSSLEESLAKIEEVRFAAGVPREALAGIGDHLRDVRRAIGAIREWTAKGVRA